MKNVLAHAGKSGRRVLSAFIATAFAQETAEAAKRAMARRGRPDPAQSAGARHHHDRHEIAKLQARRLLAKYD
jgi:hypothetical protein